MSSRNYVLACILMFINLVGFFLLYCKNPNNDKGKKYPKQNPDDNKDEDDLNNDDEPKSWYVWAIGILVCLDVWIVGAIITYIWADWYFEGDTKNIEQNKAIFGDSFGAVNALISAFAFGAMIVNFYFQRYELKLQRKELKAQRKEFTAQRMEFEQQNQTLGLQRFDNTFFNMLKLQQEIVDGLEYAPTDNYIITNKNNEKTRIVYRGREVFMKLFDNDLTSFPSILNSIRKDGVSSYCHSKNVSILDHYFRHLYTILNYIDKSPDIDNFSCIVEGEDKDKSIYEKKYEYAKILRATLSRYELIFLYYDGLSDFGKVKLKPLIEKYSMLNNLNEGLLTLSYENSQIIDGIPWSIFANYCHTNNYPPTDYLFFLTDSDNDDTRYNVSAFYHQKEDQEKELVKKSNFDGGINELKSQHSTVHIEGSK